MSATKTGRAKGAQGANSSDPQAAPPHEGVWAKIAWVQHRVEHVEKTGTVSFGKTSFSHMQEHGLIQVLRPLLRQVGLAVVFDAPEYAINGNQYVITGRLEVSDPVSGETVVKTYPNVGVDPADKGFNKALTAGSKYALQKFFQIPTEGIDDNEATEAQGVRTETSGAQLTGGEARVPADVAKQIRDFAVSAVAETDLTNRKVQGKLKASGADKIEDLTPAAAEAFQQWLVQETKGKGS